MNKVELIGRLTKDPVVRYSAGEKPMAIANFTLAVNRRFKQEGGPTADFISCVAFGKLGEFAEKYLIKGTKIACAGHIQTGHYTDKDGKEIYTTEVVCDELEFVEKKQAGNTATASDEFAPIPEDLEEEGLPFA